MLTPKEFEQIEMILKSELAVHTHDGAYIHRNHTLTLLRHFTEPDKPEAPPDEPEKDDS